MRKIKKIILSDILKDCPEGTPLYSPALGDVTFKKISEVFGTIIVLTPNQVKAQFNPDGALAWADSHNGEMMLFPSKDNRDWTTFRVPIKVIERFNPESFKPFDKVLGRDNRNFMWDATLFSHIDKESRYPLRTVSGGYKQLIPFKGNEHLAGKAGEPDEYYRYWEEEEYGQTAST